MSRAFSGATGYRRLQIESTMNQLMPRLARGELDIVVGRSGQQYDDPQLRIETLYTELINFAARPHHPLAEKAQPGWDALRRIEPRCASSS
jgi:DNA-binding transcriptional LysR family regulator